MTRPVSEQELHDYVDDRLAGLRRAAVELHLRQHPAAADRVRAYRRQNELLRALGAALERVPPAPFEERLSRALRRRLGRAHWHLLRPHVAVAAAALLAVVIGAGGAELYGSRAVQPAPAAPSFAEIATRAHLLYAAAGQSTEFGADGAAQFGSLLDQRLGAPLRLPDLSPKGFSLVGGRMLDGPAGPTAQLVYRDKTGRLVTLFVGARREDATPPVRNPDPQPVGLYTWLDGRFHVAVVGGVGGDELRALAEAAQHSLRPADAPAAPDRPAPRSEHRDSGGSRT